MGSFRAALFDLDGTLIATDRFWIQAARVGARRAFDSLGLERELPAAGEWMGLVGKPLETGFRELFPDLSDEERRTVQASCVAEEHRLLEAGGDVLMPGALELLHELRRRGTNLGVASNCSRAYLDHMLASRGLGELVDRAYCLDSPGIATKADMIARLLSDFGTRRAFFVGDRRGDRDAAWENGIPHVHCAFGFASARERFEAEATIEDLGQLLELLGERPRRLATIVEGLRPAALAASGRPPVVGIGGPPAAGKTLLAEDLAPLLGEASGLETVVLSTDPGTAGAGAEPNDHEAALVRDVLEPHARGEEVRLRTDPAHGEGPRTIPAGSLVLLEGDGLLGDRLRSRVDRLLWLEVPDALVLRRVAGRDARELGTRVLDRARERLGRLETLALRYAPERHADLRVEVRDPFRPQVL